MSWITNNFLEFYEAYKDYIRYIISFITKQQQLSGADRYWNMLPTNILEVLSTGQEPGVIYSEVTMLKHAISFSFVDLGFEKVWSLMQELPPSNPAYFGFMDKL